MQLVYLILTFLKIIITLVRDRFETDSVNVMKKGRLFQRNKLNSIYINLARSYQKTMKIVTRNNNTQNVRKATLVCEKLLRNLNTWKSIELMLFVVYNNVIFI